MQVAHHRPGLVLDTNAALDWLVFKAPVMTPVAGAIDAGQVIWLACSTMRAELKHMLEHPSLAHWQHDAHAALQLFDRLVTVMPEPQVGADRQLRCADPDDQVFIDLAVSAPARWLLTHDRALLKLAKRALRQDVHILTPMNWLASLPPPAQQ